MFPLLQKLNFKLQKQQISNYTHKGNKIVPSPLSFCTVYYFTIQTLKPRQLKFGFC